MTKQLATSTTVALGFEVSGGAPVDIPVRNMVVTGQTQESGKTTTLEALIERSGRRAVAFVTKRHERSFTRGRIIRPYFRERADWRFVAAILEATMQERFKYERPWIVRVCKGADTLADVHRNIEHAMRKTRDGSANHNAYLMLDEYLKLVVPALGRVRWADQVDLEPGLNVMDLRDLPQEIHGLVIAATVEWVYTNEDNVITVVPEAWKFIPQQRSSPVKLAVEYLVREGSGGGNYVWLDSQDIAAVDKSILKSFIVWLLGVQREANEVKRVLGHMSGLKKPKPVDVMQLERGQFFVSHGAVLTKTYVWPAWMGAADARAVAVGDSDISDVEAPAPLELPEPEAAVEEEMKEQPEPEIDMPDERLEKKIDALFEMFGERLKAGAEQTAPPAPKPKSPVTDNGQAGDFEGLYQAIRARLISDPQVIRVLQERKTINVAIQEEVIEAEGKSLAGRIALLIHRGFFKDVKRHAETVRELERTGSRVNGGNVSRELKRLVSMGFLTREGEGHSEVPGMKVNIVKK
jgi:hypothetical protein